MELQTQPKPAREKHDTPAIARFLSPAIFFFFILFAILLPWSIKGARYAWIAAFYLWLVDLFVERKRLRPQPLAAPMLAYIALSGISCAVSYEPYLSWPHMKLVCWTALVGTLFAQSLRRLSQVRTLVLLLLLSASAVAGFTAWQYTRGIGLRINDVLYQSPLYLSGLRSGDVLVTVGGHNVHSPDDLLKAATSVPGNSLLQVKFQRGFPVRRKETIAAAHEFLAGSVLTPTLAVAKTRPLRAQGTLGHPGKLAEVFAPLGCLAWALLLGTSARNRWRQLMFAVMFVAITATVFATQSRAPLSGLLLGCLIALLLLSPPRIRIALVAVLLLLAIAAGAWIQHTRGLRWVDLRDPGTQYRLLLWKDGMHLAAQHPFFGVGMDAVQNHWVEWNLQSFAAFHQFWNFHSDLVQLAAERGLLALAAWLWFAAAYLVYLFRLLPRLRKASRFASGVGTGILTGFVAFLVTSLVESSLGDDTLVMLLFFCFGVAVAMEAMLSSQGAIDVA